jgi:hypothetical protein
MKNILRIIAVVPLCAVLLSGCTNDHYRYHYRDGYYSNWNDGHHHRDRYHDRYYYRRY